MIKIENKIIGLNKPIFTIAEIGSNVIDQKIVKFD